MWSAAPPRPRTAPPPPPPRRPGPPPPRRARARPPAPPRPPPPPPPPRWRRGSACGPQRRPTPCPSAPAPPPLGSAALRMIHPEIETLAPDEAIVARVLPVYEKPTEMHVGAMRRIVHAAVDEFADRVPSALPPDVAARHRLVDLPRAFRHVHSPA